MKEQPLMYLNTLMVKKTMKEEPLMNLINLMVKKKHERKNP